jgi:tetratricopeptide (TPR) repeat protein
MKPKTRPASASLPLALWKKLLFAGVACAGFFAVLELGLALVGVRPVLYQRDPYVGFSSQMPLFVKDPATPGMLVTAENKRRIFNLQRFAAAKPPNTFRVFCMGGSTTYGHPYDDRTSFCGWLRATLPKADPSRNWELINCGGISYASYREALLMEELIRYQPDLFIIYSAHNEFLEQRTYSEIIAMPRVVRGVGAVLRKTRSFAAAKALVEKFAGNPNSSSHTQTNLLPAEVETMLDRVVGPQAYHRDPPLEQKVIDHFRFNTARMVDIARSVGARVIFVAPASNLRDCSPFKSENREGLSEPDFDKWQTLFKTAAAAQTRREWQQALASTDQALALDDRFAHLHYLRGQALWQLNRFEEAKTAFVRALDEDVCPLRALTSMVRIVREVGAQLGVPVVDFVQLLESLSEHATPGADWFLDHVHPTIEGNRRLSLALLETMTAQGIAHPSSSWGPAAIEEVKKSVESGIDAKANGLALCTAAKVIAWAGKSEEAFRLSLQAVQLAPGEAPVLFEAGKNAEHLGRHEEAINYLQKALELNGNFVEARALLGNALAARGQMTEAISQYQMGLQLQPEHAEMHCNLAALLSRQGDTQGALQHYSEALRISPNYAEAHNNLAWVFKQRGEFTEALAHFKEAVRLKPGLPAPVIGLAWLLATHPDASRRDPAQAIALSERLTALSHNHNWMSLDTLAAAYAGGGRFDEAVKTAQRALDLARTVSPNDAPAVANRLALYEQRQPYVENSK